MKTVLDLRYDNYDETTMDIYLPETKNYQTIVNFHGGGLDHGSNKEATFEMLSKAFTDAGYAFASVEYRKYPNAKYPDYIEDCAKATAYVKKYVQSHGGNGELIIMGQSAGAWLSLMLCLDKKYLAAAGIDSEEIKGWFIDSAQTTSHFNVMQQERGAHKLDQRIDEYAPLYYVNENTKFSKMQLLFYDHDMPCRYEQNMLFYRVILEFNPEADIKYKVIEGKHTSLAKRLDENGESVYLKAFLAWMEETKE